MALAVALLMTIVALLMADPNPYVDLSAPNKYPHIQWVFASDSEPTDAQKDWTVEVKKWKTLSTDLEAQLKTAKGEVEQANLRTKEAEASKVELQKKLDAAEASEKQLKKDVDALKSADKAAGEEKSKLKVEIEKLKSKLKAEAEAAVAMSQKMAKVEKAVGQFELQVKKLESQLKIKEKTEEENRKALKSGDAKIHEAEASLAQIKAQMLEFERKAKTLDEVAQSWLPIWMSEGLHFACEAGKVAWTEKAVPLIGKVQVKVEEAIVNVKALAQPHIEDLKKVSAKASASLSEGLKPILASVEEQRLKLQPVVLAKWREVQLAASPYTAQVTEVLQKARTAGEEALTPLIASANEFFSPHVKGVRVFLAPHVAYVKEAAAPHWERLKEVSAPYVKSGADLVDTQHGEAQQFLKRILAGWGLTDGQIWYLAFGLLLLPLFLVYIISTPLQRALRSSKAKKAANKTKGASSTGSTGHKKAHHKRHKHA